MAKTAAPTAPDPLREIADARFKAMAYVEQMLRDKVPDLELAGPNAINAFNVRRHFNLDELAVIDVLNWSKEDLVREVGRVHDVSRLKKIAGTSADRQAAADKLAAAREALKRKPALVEQIAKLQSEVKSLEERSQRLEHEVEQRANAVRSLREKVPTHVLAEFHRRRDNVNGGHHEGIAAAEQELLAAEVPFQTELRKAEDAVLAAESDLDAVLRAHAPKGPAERNLEVAKAALAVAGRTLAEDPLLQRARAKVADLKAARDAEIAALEAELLDQYSR